jgi:hypothetical protein
MSALMDIIAERDAKIVKQQEEITELVTAINLVYIANNTSKITGFNDLMAVVEKQNNGVFMSELSKLAAIADKCVDSGFNHASRKADEYEREINKQQEEIAELKSAIESALNIKDLWVYNGDIPKWHEGEAQALSKMHDKFVDLLAKHNKGE